MALFDDDREVYWEQRMIGIGLFNAVVVVIVHVEVSDDEIRIISMRKATRHETELYYQMGYF